MRTFSEKLSFASASLTAGLLLQYFQSKAEFFYITELKFSPRNYALALAVYALWNIINDPVIGFQMDQRPTRWGRRLPYMIGFWIPLVLGFALIWSPPEIAQENHLILFLWLVFVLLLFDTSYTVVILAWAALFPENYRNPADRSQISGLKQIFGFISTGLALLLPPFFVKDNDIQSYQSYGIFLAIVAFINLGFAFYGSQEKDYEGLKSEYTLTEGITTVIKNKPFRTFLVVNLIIYFAYGQVLSMLPFYRKFVLNVDQDFEIIAYTAAGVVTFIAITGWIVLAPSIDARKVYLFSALSFCVSVVPLWFVTNQYLVLFFFGFTGFGLSGMLIVSDLLMADIIDADTVESQQHREGIYYGFNGMFIRFAIFLQAISLLIIAWATGFDQNSETQSSIAQNGIKLQMIGLPFFAMIIGFLLMKYRYKLYGESLIDIRLELQSR